MRRSNSLCGPERCPGKGGGDGESRPRGTKGQRGPRGFGGQGPTGSRTTQNYVKEVKEKVPVGLLSEGHGRQGAPLGVSPEWKRDLGAAEGLPGVLEARLCGVRRNRRAGPGKAQCRVLPKTLTAGIVPRKTRHAPWGGVGGVRGGVGTSHRGDRGQRHARLELESVASCGIGGSAGGTRD